MSKSRHWASIGEAGALAGLRFMAWTYRLLGRVGFNIVLAPVMFYFLLRRPIARRASLDYLRRVKREYPDSIRGEPGLWMTFRHFLAFGRSLLDSPDEARSPALEHVARSDRRAQVADGLVATGHQGSARLQLVGPARAEAHRPAVEPDEVRDPR